MMNNITVEIMAEVTKKDYDTLSIGIANKTENLLDICNNSLNEEYFVRLGPSDLVEVEGQLVTAFYLCLFGLVSLLWVYAVYNVTKAINSSTYQTYLQFAPVLNITLTSGALISPPSVPLVSLLQDMVSVAAMVVFTRSTYKLIGGEDIVTMSLCNRDAKCPIGTPPCCFLLPCPNPRITRRLWKFILLPLKLLVFVILINFIINMYMVYSGFYPTKVFGAVENIHNVIIIPFFISTMYTYKIFVSVCGPLLPDTNFRLRGNLNFFMFAMCKTVFAIVNGLNEFGVIPCLPGLPSYWLGVLIASFFQILILSPIALVIPRLYVRDLEMIGLQAVSR